MDSFEHEIADKPDSRDFRRDLFQFLERGVLLAMGSISLGSWGFMLLRMFGDVHPCLEMAAHPSLHLFVACFLVLLIEGLFWLFRRDSAYASPRWKRRLIFTLVPFLFFGWATSPWKLLPLRSVQQTNGSLKILSWNMLLVNRHYSDVVELVRRESPDMIALIELSPSAVKELEVLKADYSYGLWMPEWQGSGIAFVSRIPVDEAKVKMLANQWMSAIELEITRKGSGKKLNLLAVHTLSPNIGNAIRTRIRDAQLQDIATWSREKMGSAIVVGDFNISPWSPAFWRMLEYGKLTDSSWYRGYFSSWPAIFGRVGIPIDHALVNENVKVLDRYNLFGESHSDHIPILISIE